MELVLIGDDLAVVTAIAKKVGNTKLYAHPSTPTSIAFLNSNVSRQSMPDRTIYKTPSLFDRLYASRVLPISLFQDPSLFSPIKQTRLELFSL